MQRKNASFFNTLLVYRSKFQLRETTCAVLVVIAIGFTAFMMHPGLRPRWDVQYRQRVRSEFLTSLESGQQINPQTFWLFRERYSPGTFRINESAVSVFQTFRITHLNDRGTTELLYYESPFISSTESVTTSSETLESAKNQLPILISADNFVVSQVNDTELSLTFLLPISEMKRANGFFDYLPAEQELLANKLWLSQSIIRLK